MFVEYEYVVCPY